MCYTENLSLSSVNSLFVMKLCMYIFVSYGWHACSQARLSGYSHTYINIVIVLVKSRHLCTCNDYLELEMANFM